MTRTFPSVRHRNLLLIGAITCLLISPVLSAQTTFKTTSDIYAFGDVHGAYQALVDLLDANGLIDQNLNWTGGDAYLVSVGDLIDRGADSRKVMDLLMGLQEEAIAAGGRVLVTLGNHEVMNLLAEYQDVSVPEIEAFGELPDYAQAMSSSGRYGQWLQTLPVMVQVNETIFVHGGLTPTMAQIDVNGTTQSAIKVLQSYGEQKIAEGTLQYGQSYIEAALSDEQAPEEVVNSANSAVLGYAGVLWYRGNAGCHALLEQQKLQQALRIMGAHRIVVGHTPTPQREVVSRFDGAVVVVDTGMLKQAYRGQSRLLRIRDQQITVFNDRGNQVDLQEEGVGRTSSLSRSSPAGQKLSRAQRRALAAERLDHLLELNLVVPVDLEEDLSAFSDTVLSETSRQERGWRRPNYCGARSEYDLVSVFDSLIGKLDRSGADLGYDPRSWQIRLTNHVKAFTNSRKIPSYVQPPNLPQVLADKLKALNAQQLHQLFSDLLTTKQIKALLARRDKILTWPIVN